MKKHLTLYAPIYIIIVISLFIGAFIEQEIVRYRLDKYISETNLKLDRDSILYGKKLDYNDYSH
jgi:hypothetical protein